MSRIEQAFEARAKNKQKVLIPFITAGDPHPDVTLNLMNALVDGGADLIELGIPFSDPMADGPVIQRASERALKHKVGLVHVLEMVRAFRESNKTTPVVLMGYANPIERMGYDTFASEASKAGVDGVLVVDLPPEESDKFVETLAPHQIAPIYLLAPTTPEFRVKAIAERAKGYVYYVSLKGVTGAAHVDYSAVGDRMPELKKYLNVPVGVGFGISDGQGAAAVAKVADAVIIGSRLVKEIESSSPETMADNLRVLVSSIRTAMDEATA
ncbi:tryptophan synthase subunit alpha [Leeia sp. TBRC 13508]|uniref:Tryptophan synthase alpha chain n=1 Tax=Leeia speluncae TaxID=2884804 RepID=A0ABS8DAM7_9NEIS|nr:tryptophan synthase subunit alpha [Leeia speluncae]MCB6185255.1 tryptophan synthase subunit alpha [Leeia speluncae]